MARAQISSPEETLRGADYDRYLSALFARAWARPHLLALYAFNYEIAKTAESVSQPVIGQIRLQWWRDSIAGIYEGKTREHETVQALARAIQGCALPCDLFEAMIEAREYDLDEAPFADMAALDAYCDATSGHLMRLALRVLGAEPAFDAAAGEAGIAYALTGLLRALPFHAARRRLTLPADGLRAANVTADEIFAGRGGEGLASSIAGIADRAQSHLQAARAIPLPRRYQPALLPAALTPSYLAIMSAPGFDIFRDATDLPLHRRQWAMLRAKLRGRI